MFRHFSIFLMLKKPQRNGRDIRVNKNVTWYEESHAYFRQFLT